MTPLRPLVEFCDGKDYAACFTVSRAKTSFKFATLSTTRLQLFGS